VLDVWYSEASWLLGRQLLIKNINIGLSLAV